MYRRRKKMYRKRRSNRIRMDNKNKKRGGINNKKNI